MSQSSWSVKILEISGYKRPPFRPIHPTQEYVFECDMYSDNGGAVLLFELAETATIDQARNDIAHIEGLS